MSKHINRLSILNVWVDPVDMDGAIERVQHFVESGDRPHSVFAVNPEKNFSVPCDPQLHKVFREADLLIPDGIGVVMAARLLYGVQLTRVPGVEMMDEICHLSARMGYRVFIYGAKEEVSDNAAAILQKRYPSLDIVGRANGYVTPEEMPTLIERINTSCAQVLFLALGSPRQENWYATYASKLHTVRVCQGIGGTLDTIAGTVKRAPHFWCRLNLEWLYRLLAEPKRIGRQLVLPIFAYLVFRRKIDMIFH
jgi:N-acetylglucosaminyldiphosphoundecaprenol N-acetyl-beta-D-mannosaminyltransferase